MKVKIAVSARHLHLSLEDLKVLFGEDYSLKVRNNLSQTGEFAADEQVVIRGPKGEIKGVRVIGPIRKYTQIEITKTDAYFLGLNPPVRDSGDIEGSSAIEIEGPNGKVLLDKGCIIASRHIHLNKEEALGYGLQDGSVVKVRVNGIKGGVMDNVHVKLKDDFVFEMHIDLDDANAHLLNNGDEGEIINE